MYTKHMKVITNTQSQLFVYSHTFPLVAFWLIIWASHFKYFNKVPAVPEKYSPAVCMAYFNFIYIVKCIYLFCLSSLWQSDQVGK